MTKGEESVPDNVSSSTAAHNSLAVDYASVLSYGPLDVVCADLRSKTIVWQDYFQSGIFTADEMSVLTDLNVKGHWPEYLKKDGETYLLTALAALDKIGSTEASRSLLVILDDLFAEWSELVERLLLEQKLDSLRSISRFVESGDDFEASEAARLITRIALSTSFALKDPDMFALLTWIDTSLRAFDKEVCCLATLCLQALIRREHYREKVFAHDSTITALLFLLKASRNPQVQYNALFSIWLLSFKPEIAMYLQKRYEIITVLVDIAKSAMKEKIIRVCVAIWKNLLTKAREATIAVMIGAKVLDFLDRIASKQNSDEELVADTAFLHDELARAFQSLSCFDEYASEIKSGKLEWSPPHKSILFWRDNAAKLEGNDKELLRILTKLLQTSTDPIVLSVAAHDIGQYVENHPSGKRFIEELGTKQQIMLLISHSDSDVRYHALSTIQKYMSNLW